MTPRLLPIGSYIILPKSFNIPGLPVTNKWTANGVNRATNNCAQYMVRTDSGYWLYVPTGAHKGWYEIPSVAGVQFCKAPPPQDVLDVIAAHEADEKAKADAAAGIKSAAAIRATEDALPTSPAGRAEMLTDLLNGIPVHDEDGNMVGRSAPLLSAAEAQAILKGATTGAEPQPQTSDKPAAA